MPRPLRKRFCYVYPRPCVAVDMVLVGVAPPELSVLLIQRGGSPFKGCWALPGGFVEEDESLENAARRELEEETGLRDVSLQQVGAFGDPGRDPRARVVSVAYAALVDPAKVTPRASDDAAAVGWFRLKSLPKLAFDHAQIIDAALRKLREGLERRPLARHVLPKRFTSAELRRVYMTLLGEPVNTSKLVAKMMREGVLERVNAARNHEEKMLRFQGKGQTQQP